jgi:hypothetical protein
LIEIPNQGVLALLEATAISDDPNNFSLVEIDSSYCAQPAPPVAEL